MSLETYRADLADAEAEVANAERDKAAVDEAGEAILVDPACSGRAETVTVNWLVLPDLRHVPLA